MRRRAPRVVLVGVDPWLEASSELQPFNYGLYRVLSALKLDENAEIHLVEAKKNQTETLTQRVLELAPDIVGLSAYVWSMPFLWNVARAVRAHFPSAWIVLGGPCARPEMLALEPWNDAPRLLDAVVTGDGETPMRALLRAYEQGARPGSVAGVLVPDGARFRASLAKPIDDSLRVSKQQGSPFQNKLVPAGKTAHLERFAGCPLSCTFCQWGELDASDVQNTEALVQELEAYRSSKANGVMIVDAGLNLHAPAFRSLLEAEARVGFLKETMLHCELYPASLQAEHLEFLSGVRAKVGVGLQSYNQDVLSTVQRRAQVEEFERLVQRIGAVAEPTIEMILGLPGDRPASFLASFARARTLPYAVRVYQCLVLPDALMTRGGPELRLHYDPVTLELRSSVGWSEEELTRMKQHLDALIAEEGGFGGYSWWHFPPKGTSADASRAGRPLSEEEQQTLQALFAKATQDTWTLEQASQRGSEVLLRCLVRGEALAITVRPRDQRPCYRVEQGLAFSWSRAGNKQLDARTQREFEALLPLVAKFITARSHRVGYTPL